MNTSETDKCKRCGAIVPASSYEKLCPACLMSGAMKPPKDKADTITHISGESKAHSGISEFPTEFGGYKLLGLLGSGGMGTVYEAEQITTGRRVALKMLGQQLDSPEMRQRFLREGRLAAGVSHPNSLYIFGSEEIEDVPVITMEITASGTLKDKLKKRGPFPIPEAVDAILDVISGLEAALTAGVLHRDIKPSNCFVSPDGSVKIGDFGLSVSTLARDDSYITASGIIMGTPAFASPEQLRGDTLDVRADIYSVGATLFTLLTGKPPFEGANVVQVVANVVNQKPKPLSELREDIPRDLERVVARCLSKKPDGRYDDYTALRNALLPFSSKEPEPASMTVRAPAGWIDYLIAFMIPYVILMLTVGAEELLVQPLVERTLYSARYYFLLLGSGFLYFSIVEGLWGAGLGKWLKGLHVIRKNGRRPGMGRALLRVLIPILCVEGVRMPLMMVLISDATWTGLQTALYVIAAIVCGWIPTLLILRTRRENGFATVWDLLSGTRVQVKPKGIVRPSVESAVLPELSAKNMDSIGPFQVIGEVVPGKWIIATDPVLRRQVWLLGRNSLKPSLARQNLARTGRLRWLQKVESGDITWDAYEATQGTPFSSLVEGGKRLPWSSLRHWLHDLASELWKATGDNTMPLELSLDHVWITTQGNAVLLDQPWPDVMTSAEHIPVGDLSGQQLFLNAVAACVEPTSLPVHARGLLKNLKDGKFEKLSFFTGNLRGLLDKPSEVSKGIRAGSIFMLPLYVWIMFFIGSYKGGGSLLKTIWGSIEWIALISAVMILIGCALIQALELPFRTFLSHLIFRLAVVNAKGEPARISELLVRWAIVWLPLFLPMALLGLLIKKTGTTAAFILALALLFLWIGAAVYAVFYPHRGLHDRLAGTWIVRL